MTPSSKQPHAWIEGITSKQVESSLSDPRTSSIHRQHIRRILVSVNLVIMLLMLASSQIWPDEQWRVGLDLVVFALLVLMYLALRKSVRHLSDAPNELLDERQIQVRDASYTIAYRTLAAVTITAFLLVSVAVSISFENAWMAIYVAYLMFATGLPAMVLAWNMPNDPQD